jgi:hypothetical protein
MRLDKNEQSEVCVISRIIPGAERRGTIHKDITIDITQAGTQEIYSFI